MTSSVIATRCRWVSDTIRVESTRTRLPDGVRHEQRAAQHAVAEVEARS